jgi:hypothetical protein
MLLLLLPFSFFLFLDFRVRYEFSDMAKRERGGKESLSPPIAQRRVCRIC